MKKVVFIVIGVVIVLAAVVALVMSKDSSRIRQTGTDSSASQSDASSDTGFTDPEPSSNSGSQTASVMWDYMNDGWKANGTAPDCPSPLTFKTPVDLAKVSGILYPGQTRGGDYKAHGGFRFDSIKDGKTTVTVPMDAQVVEGSRYIEIGETQHMFDFQTSCGIRYRFDHLHTLSPTFQALADQLPAAKADDTRTTKFSSPVDVKAGDTIATAVGFPKAGNTSVDWGVYDLRTKNEASKNATWAAQHNAQLAHYGVCWFDWLSSADAATVKALPAADPTSGKTSDYCK